MIGSKNTHHPMAGRLPIPNTNTKQRAFNATVKMSIFTFSVLSATALSIK